MLQERERNILIYRFGLDGSEPKTLGEASKKFGVTRERIRQIEIKAIRKLRYKSRGILERDFSEYNAKDNGDVLIQRM